jgi:hypothetical protein
MLGKRLHLMDKYGNIMPYTFWITFLFVGGALLITLIKVVATHSDSVWEVDSKFFHRLFTMESRFEGAHWDSFRKYMRSFDGSVASLQGLIESFKPDAAIDTICKSFVSFFRCLAGTDVDDDFIRIAILERKKENGAWKKWHRLSSAPREITDNDLGKMLESKLFKNAEESDYPQMEQKEKSSLYEAEESEVISTKAGGTELRLNGSIIYYKAELKKNDDAIVQYMITLSSYNGTHLFSEGSREVVVEALRFMQVKILVFAAMKSLS